MKKYKSILSAIGLSSAFLLTHCGAPEPKVETQENGTPPVLPNYQPYNEVFSLTKPLFSDKEQFEGSIVFHHPEATVKGLEKAIDLSGDIKKIKFAQAAAYKKGVNRLNEIFEIQTKMSYFELKSDETFNKAKDALDRFIQERVLSTEEKTHHFCEQILWQSATSTFAASEEFTKPPVNTDQCDAFYKEKGYLNPEEDANCKVADGQKRNFMDCLWGNTGVQKNTSFKANLEAESMFGDKLDWDWKTAREILTSKFTINELRSTGEYIADDQFTRFQIFPHSIAEFKAKRFKKVKDQLNALAKNEGGASIFEFLAFYPSLNQLGDKSPFNRADSKLEGAFEPLIAENMVFSGVLSENDFKRSQEDIKLLQDITAEKVTIVDEVDNKLSYAYQNERIKSSKILKEEKISISALSGYRFDVTPGKESTELDFKIGHQSHKLCINLQDNSVDVCEGQEKAINPWEFNWDAATGKIDLKVTLKDLETINLEFKEPEENGDSFQLIPNETLLGKVLHIKAYPRTLQNTLDYISGSALIEDTADNVIYEGSITLFREYKMGKKDQD